MKKKLSKTALEGFIVVTTMRDYCALCAVQSYSWLFVAGQWEAGNVYSANPCSLLCCNFTICHEQ